MRYALLGASSFSPLTSFTVLLGITMVVLGIGVYQFNRVEL
jgi:hypothetical protein